MKYHFFIILKGLLLTFLTLKLHTGFSQKYDAELTNRQTVIDVSEGKLVESHYFELRINNRNGDKYAEVSIPFQKMNKVTNIEASITDADGKEVKRLKKSDIIERNEGSPISFYDDTYVKEFALRNNTYPYTFRYSYRIESSQFIFITAWTPVIDKEIPTWQATLKLSAPEGYRLNYTSNLIDKPGIDSIPGHVYYSWKASFTSPVKAEAWSPPLMNFFPYVEVVPEKFNYEEGGNQKSWQSFGNWNLSLLQGLSDLPQAEMFKIHAITDSITDKKEKIRALFHYLQDATRYINVSIKTGGLKPFPASYVAENKFGDCKALANYFKSCLSLINIEAFYTTIYAGTQIVPIETGFPSQQFNHVILFIPIEQDTLWVDCTSDLAFGYLGTFTQNRPALVLSPDASSLINTPALTFEQVMEYQHIAVNFKPDGKVEADFINTYKGEKYEMLSYMLIYFSESQRMKYLGKTIAGSEFQMETYSLNVPFRDKPEIVLKYTALSEHFFQKYSNEALIKIFPIDGFVLEDPAKRKLPVQIDYPVFQVDTIEYKLPENYHLSKLPQNVKLSSAYGEYQAEFVPEEDSIIVIKQLKINAGSYPLDEYQAFYAFMKSILDSEDAQYITLKNK
jgi:hypothetical protein